MRTELVTVGPHTDTILFSHLGDWLFAEGNVKEAFWRFRGEHNCDTNPFCRFYNPGVLVDPNETIQEPGDAHTDAPKHTPADVVDTSLEAPE